MIAFLAINALLGIVLPNIDVLAHLGGLLAGFLLGLGFDSGKGTTATAAAGLQTAVALAVTGAAIALVVLS
jgi:membrane associated rhomboid family serine protease